MLVTTSPGFTAKPSGIFSQAGIKPTTFSFGFSKLKDLKTPSTLAAPPMSNFISSISGAGLIEIPPVSNVMPLPTNTTGASVLAAPWYFKIMNRRGSAEPWATDMNEPMPNLATSFGPKTAQEILGVLANTWAALPNRVGVAWLAGRLAHSLANSMPWTIAADVVKASFKAALAAATPKTTWVNFRVLGLEWVVP